MNFTIFSEWWVIPAVISMVGLIWAAFIVDPGEGIGTGMNNIFALAIVGLVSAVAWAIAGALK